MLQKQYFGLWRVRNVLEIDGLKAVANEVEANEVEANEVEANEVEANEVEANEVEANEVEANEVEKDGGFKVECEDKGKGL